MDQEKQPVAKQGAQQDAQPVAHVNVKRDAAGAYWFALTWRGVTQPVSGPFRNQLEAAAAGQAAVRAMEKGRKP